MFISTQKIRLKCVSNDLTCDSWKLGYCVLHLLREILNFQESQVKSFETHFSMLVGHFVYSLHRVCNVYHRMSDITERIGRGTSANNARICGFVDFVSARRTNLGSNGLWGFWGWSNSKVTLTSDSADA
eukprot:sb/3475274/